MPKHNKNEPETHIGAHIRRHIIPADMSVTKAAELLGVGRPALSNLLNGKAQLSPDMAQRLERAFGAKAEELLQQQAKAASDIARTQTTAQTAKAHVPTFLDITSRDIEDWGADRIFTRSRFAILLRRLVISTVSSLKQIDFPANDDSQRAGWDGYTIADAGNPWVPNGACGWEFGTNKKPKEKADKDYEKSLKLPLEERRETTFIFVTTMRWTGKKTWADERRAKNEWKDVRAYDASDLEQWLEQSVSAQTWFANETKRDARGTRTLPNVWNRWSADCEPALHMSLFAEALAGDTGRKIRDKLDQSGSVTIAADSRDEGVAFIAAAFAEHSDLQPLHDQVVLFEDPEVLARVAGRNIQLIPLVASAEVELELAPFKGILPCIVVQPKNISGLDADITLETLGYAAFETAMKNMGYSHLDLDQLTHASGRSITVLRRYLSRTPAIRKPVWSQDLSLARALLPIALAGSWDTRSDLDRDVLAYLKHAGDYGELERDHQSLLAVTDDAPVWSVGSFRGVVSRIDAFFAISDQMTEADIDRFFEAAELVLGEDDPALDLPDDERWMANIKHKRREISGPLRHGMAEALVIFAVYGEELFGDRFQQNPGQRVEKLIRKLLTPLTGRVLEAHSHELPMYAEAAPEVLLDILQKDLSSDQPAVFELIRPAGTGLWGANPRTGLLWALENIAWSPKMLPSVATILARLSARKLDDNWTNKPINSLKTLVSHWFPQTAAPIEQRVAVLENVVIHYPDIGWELCLDQITPGPKTGSYNHRPRWRADARGVGRGVTYSDRSQMARRALDLILDWPHQTEMTLSELIRCAQSLPDEDHCTVWALVESWSATASEDEKARLREVVRQHYYTRRARKLRASRDDQPSAAVREALQAAFAALEPNDLVQAHAWLFLQDWVEWSADELEEDQEQFIGTARDERIAAARTKAVSEIFTSEGIAGLIRLALVGKGGHSVGVVAAQFLTEASQQFELIQAALSDLEPSHELLRLINGLLFRAEQEGTLQQILAIAHDRLTKEKLHRLAILAPFGRPIWNFVRLVGEEFDAAYWQNVRPGILRDQPEDLAHAIAKLLAVGRPRACLDITSFELENIPDKTIHRILQETVVSKEEFPVGQMERYAITDAIKHLQQNNELDPNNLAKLEFMYLNLLKHNNDGTSIPNLERQVNEHPELFVQALTHVFRRTDGQEDPPELRTDDPEQISSRASQSYTFLTMLSSIPGRDDKGKVQVRALVRWIEMVRAQARSLAREDIADSQVGQLLAKSSTGADGFWPCEAVRDAMEVTLSTEMSRGFQIGKLNLRGVHHRAEGGSQERALAAEFDASAQALLYSHPRVSQVLSEIRDTYLDHAKREDTEAKIRKRLRH